VVRPRSYPEYDPPAIGQHGKSLQEHAKAFVDMEPHVDALVSLAKDCKVILELGVRSGVSTWAFLTGLPEDGKLIAVDFDERIINERWLPPQVANDPRFEYIEGDDTDPGIIKRFPLSPDLVFIDTSHTYEHTFKELRIVSLIDAKKIVLHDYALDDVRNAIEKFMESNPYKIAFIEESTWGLAVLERLTEQ
jgi:predicted O-methyltransferase YrrM